jgi:lactate dehydrogenase-like 2-hydroxyacid dehydrogenase
MRNIKLIIVLKTVPMTAITLGLVGNTNIANMDSQVVIIGQF